VVVEIHDPLGKPAAGVLVLANATTYVGTEVSGSTNNAG